MEPKWLEEIKERARTGASRNLGPDRRVLLAHIRELRSMLGVIATAPTVPQYNICSDMAEELLNRQEPPEVQ